MKSIGIGWVESIYQKLETVYADVDITINQAPMEFVRNPAQAVAQSVKKFCSDVMQDLLLPQMNSRDEEGDVPAISSGDSGISEGHMDSRDEEGDEVYGAADQLRQETVNSVQSYSPLEKQVSNINETDTICAFETETNAASVTTTDASTHHCDSSPATVSTMVFEKYHAGGSVFHELTEPDHEFRLTITSYTNPREDAPPKCRSCKSDDMCSNPDPLSEGFSVQDIKSNHRRRSLRSYKKLLQDTFKSRKRIVKEYKQFGIWYGDIHGEPECCKPTQSPLTSDSQDLTIEELDLSEWELL